MSNKKTILISGGKRGIGAAIAASLNPDQYIIYAPNSQEMDVSNPSRIDQYFTDNDIKHLDILINNAGIFHTRAFLQEDFTEWQKTIDVNLNGCFHLCQKAIPLMQKQAWGRIINISSISAQGEAYATAYSASKAALIGFTKSLALEFAKDGISVNAVCPGWVKTDMAKAQLCTAEKEAANIGASLQNRWIDPKEIAALVQYLISAESQAVTGQAINITAGLDL